MTIVLSVLLLLCCLIAGFMVSYHFLAEKFPQLEGIRSAVEQGKSIVGLVAVIIGIWSLISHHLYGDFIPAVLSIACGIMLADFLLGYINLSLDPATSDLRKEKLNDFLDQFKIYLGFASIVFGFIHLFDVILYRGLFPFV